MKQLPCQKPFKHLISLISFLFEHPSISFMLTYLSILILTGLVGSQVIRLLQGMIWSGPLLYSQASSSAVIMLLCVSDLTVIILTQCLHRAGPGLRLAQCTGCGSGRAPRSQMLSDSASLLCADQGRLPWNAATTDLSLAAL